MAEASITKNSVVKFGHAADSLTEVNRNVAMGLENFSHNFTPSLRQVPSGDSGTHRQSLERKDFQIEFSIDRNATSRSLFLGREGQPIYFELGVDGPATGSEKLTGKLLMSQLNNRGSFNGVLKMAVTLMIDGEVAEGTY